LVGFKWLEEYSSKRVSSFVISWVLSNEYWVVGSELKILVSHYSIPTTHYYFANDTALVSLITVTFT
jgi:hypothetical protein